MNKDISEEQILAQEMAKLHQLNRSVDVDSTLNEKKVYESLKSDFPKEAYSTDSSRGFNLTSIKAQYVVERLNDVLGFMNWSHGGEHVLVEDGKGVLFKGALVVNLNGKTNRFFATGYSDIKKNLGDAYKGAKTDALCKAASQIGVGNDAFKGLIDPKTFVKKSSGSSVMVSTDETSVTVEKTPSSFQTRTKRSRRKPEVAMTSDDI